ncbi:DUF4123 domain-containing protein [Marinobacter sp. 1Y8]
MSDPLTFRASLEAALERVEANCASGESARIYLVLSGTSQAEPVRHFFDRDGLTALPLYLGTPYAGWQPVMPYLAEISMTSPFVDWIDDCDTPDWGWAALSTEPMDSVFAHLRSLTQITIGKSGDAGKAVFFRHWDARFLAPLFDSLDSQHQAALLGPVSSWIAPDGEERLHPAAPAFDGEKTFPWFVLPPAAEQALASHCRDVLVDNTVAALHKVERSPIAAYPAPVARQKVQRHLRRVIGDGPVTEIDQTTLQTLQQRLQQEAERTHSR